MQRGEQEVLYMMRRTLLQTKKEKKKRELDKTQNSLRQAIELALKQQNRVSQNEILDLSKLGAKFSFKLQDQYKDLINPFKFELKEYICIQNEYLQTKFSEERAKIKKPKLTQTRKLELVSFEQECDRVFKELTAALPEHVKSILISQHLMPLFGIFSQDELPVKGYAFSQLNAWPTFTPVGKA